LLQASLENTAYGLLHFIKPFISLRFFTDHNNIEHPQKKQNTGEFVYDGEWENCRRIPRPGGSTARHGKGLP
jgi:hypothetical protein